MHPASPAAAERRLIPPFDVELAAYLPELQKFTAPDCLRPDTLDDVRAKMAEWPTPSPEDIERNGTFLVSEVRAPGSDGWDVPLLICRPRESLNQALPVLYFIHGGGMVMGNNRLGLEEVLDRAAHLNLVVVSVDYRLAPEFPHPTPVEDCYSGLQWLAFHGGGYGVDPRRIILYGESAGGGLAASLALLARDRGEPTLLGQLLVAPMLDDRNDTHSSHQMAGFGIWDRTCNQTGWDALLGRARGGPDVSAYASAARATNLRDLPSTYLDCGSAETFRDEIVSFASRIWAAGGSADLHVWAGGFHAFYLDVPQAKISQAAIGARTAWLARLLADH